MKLHAILIVGLAICVSACAEKKEPAVEPQAAAPAEPAPAETPAVEEESARDAEFIEHMHAHAEQLDNLNFALDDGDLPRALTAAYWLSGHQEVSGIREEWRPYLEGMREAAKSIEEAKDLDAARAAAERITEQCQGCHDAAGVKN
ncbi:hypothetical protein GWP57_15575 [Gammaproteobacteria bacterium]|jgi:soluble cytochrome b562|nr:hypothetical protein [Gammaproteobacteria bacterium]